MKIDIHTHTKKCKSGDAPTRDVSPEVFREKVLATDVRIIAITNHNHFDLAQYREIAAALGQDAQVWPGIEIDVCEQSTRGHLLVIVSPDSADDFAATVDQLTADSIPDNFSASINEVHSAFDYLGPLYVAHYKQKKPSISDAGIAELESKTSNPRRVVKEVTNAISAGIYISHGHASIYGSDLHDWSKYEEIATQLPELRLPVESFDHFCLLLEKDSVTINTLLDQKTSEELTLTPFGDETELKIRVYNDINVIFGTKGTGKSCILRAIAKHYSDNGTDARVYESASDRLDEIFDVKGKQLTRNLEHFDISYCTDEIEALRSAREVSVTNLGNYSSFFTANITNRNGRKLRIKEIPVEDENAPKRGFEDFKNAVQTTGEFLEFLSENDSVRSVLDESEHSNLIEMLTELLLRLKKMEWSSFRGWKEVFLLNSAVEKFRSEVSRKTGTPAKPTTTGFGAYAINRLKIEASALQILKSIQTKIPSECENVGSLGPNKGNLEFRTEFVFQTGNISDSTLKCLQEVTKTLQKEFSTHVQRIAETACTEELFGHIASMNEIEGIEKVKSIYELLMFKRYFAINNQKYSPSSGESSMLMLQKELGEDKDVYILDEPERSLGNEYINDTILPLIQERAKSGKKVFISTHDANIAVRTLPYSSIYRCYDTSGYKTYAGNPFSNHLVCLSDENDLLDWKMVSMKTLEGGEEAFGERGSIYGKS